jgi:5-methyltetrahydrofolate--homocysteine methyltransferase
MNIDFSPARWQRIKTDYSRWWAGELARPLIAVEIPGRDPGRPAPDLPMKHFTAAYDCAVPPEKIVDRWTYQLESKRYLGDGFPSIWPNFGPGIMAGFLGADVEADDRTVWFHQPREQDIAEIELTYDPDNKWLNRIKEICRCAIAHWDGLVQLGMTDLGGNLDVVSSFRPSERLLLDLYDHPDDVKRLTWQVHDLWQRYYSELNAILQPDNPGYTAWTPIFSSAPYYMLQCDFCYMIGPQMFDEFVKPELAETCRTLANPFYHLDGPGQLPHLDSLLEIPELKGVQWIMGDGQPGHDHWLDVHRTIISAGKRDQLFIYGDWHEVVRVFDTVADAVGSARGMILLTSAQAGEEDDVRRFLERYDVPVD